MPPKKENKKVCSVAMMPSLHQKICKLALHRGQSVSDLIGKLVEQVVKLDPEMDYQVIAVMPEGWRPEDLAGK